MNCREVCVGAFKQRNFGNVKMKRAKKADFCFGVPVVICRFALLCMQRVRVGHHHSVGIKVGMLVLYRAVDDVKVYRQHQRKPQLIMFSYKLHKYE